MRLARTRGSHVAAGPSGRTSRPPVTVLVTASGLGSDETSTKVAPIPATCTTEAARTRTRLGRTPEVGTYVAGQEATPVPASAASVRSPEVGNAPPQEAKEAPTSS